MNLNSTDSKHIRRFGLAVLIFFGCLCSLGVFLKRPMPTYIFGSFTVLGLGFILVPNLLKPVYLIWLKITHFLGRLITSLILTMAYYLVITPSALIKRLIGGAPLPTKPDKDIPSYWVGRTEPFQPKERYLKRY